MGVIRAGAFGLAVSLVGLTAGCSGTRVTRYAGTMTPQAGSCSPMESGSATLVVRGTEAVFTPGDGVVTLTGEAARPVTLAADGPGHVRTSRVQPGPGGQPSRFVFEGDGAGRTVRGTYASARCRAAVTLEQR